MNSETLDVQLVTFMYFLHKTSNDDDLAPEEFFKEWEDNYCIFDDLSEGRDYE